jgi:hypothetical protein
VANCAAFSIGGGWGAPNRPKLYSRSSQVVHVLTTLSRVVTAIARAVGLQSQAINRAEDPGAFDSPGVEQARGPRSTGSADRVLSAEQLRLLGRPSAAP